MNIILGASGQVGSLIVKALHHNNQPVRAIVRDPKKAIFERKVQVRTADLFNPSQLTQVLEGGTAVFLLTPENPASPDILGETQQLIENYQQAIRANGIKKIVALSCVGAHIEKKTGNILMSRILEQGLEDLKGAKVIIRPSYYYSNWLGFLDTVQQYKVLPSFFPEDMKLEMNSPKDLARFVADVFLQDAFTENRKIVELVGPDKYSAREVAETFAEQLGQPIAVQVLPQEKWKATLTAAGFTDNAAQNLMEMTQSVIDYIAVLEDPDRAEALPTPLEDYLKEQVGL